MYASQAGRVIEAGGEYPGRAAVILRGAKDDNVHLPQCARLRGKLNCMKHAANSARYSHKRYRHRHELMAWLFISSAAAFSTAPAAVAETGVEAASVEADSVEAAQMKVLAQGTAQGTKTGKKLDPSQITQKVTDTAGVLSSSEKSELERKIKQLQKDRQVVTYVVYTDTFGNQDAEQFASAIVRQHGPNSAAIVASFEDQPRKFGIQTGDQWPVGLRDDMYSDAYPQMVDGSYGQAALAAVDTALAGGSTGSGGSAGSGSSGSGDGGGAGWMAGGLGALALAGGGLWATTRRGRKKNEQATLESARQIEAGDTNRLAQLDTQTLTTLADEELVSTDESIRRGKEELDLAIAEFGPERVRPFTKAMNHSTSTLQRAFQLKQQLNDAIEETEPQRRQMLIDIITSCGLADDALDKESERFAEMRNLLINAGTKINELTQKTVDLRTRLPQVQSKLDALSGQYPAQVLESISENPEMAAVALDESEKHLAQARELDSKPAGQQGGLVAAIRAAEEAAQLADKLMKGVENAETNIADAKANLPLIVTEIKEEIAEARQLENQGMKQGTKANWDALNQVIDKAQKALREAEQTADSDPLGQYTKLVEMDTEVDNHLDPVREQTQEHSRILALFAQQMNVANSQIQAAEDLISSRGRIIGSSARTALADSKRLNAQALQAKDSNPHGALEAARSSAAAAATALKRAQDDIDAYRRSQQAQQFSNGAGNIITGMVIGSMLNGGGYGGGFGGGFGGGGGGFSGGGGGGGFSGGTF